MADFAKENQFTPDQQAEIDAGIKDNIDVSIYACLLYTSPSPRDATLSRMPSSA